MQPPRRFWTSLKTSLACSLLTSLLMVAGLLLLRDGSSPAVSQVQQTPAEPVEPAKPPKEEPSQPSPTLEPKRFQGVAWLTLIVSPDHLADGARWRADPQVNELLRLAGVQYRAMLSTDEYIDRLNYKPSVVSAGTPCAILQAESGRLLGAPSLSSLSDLISLAASLNR